MKKGSRLAVFPTLKKAFDAEGWTNYDKERTRSMPYFRDKIEVQKVPAGVSISCFELLEIIGNKKTAISHAKQGSIYLFTIEAYNREYELTVEYDTRHEIADYHNGDRGVEEVGKAYDYDVPIAINLAQEMGEDGPKIIHLNKWAEDQLLNYINLEE